ncbi:unnamed protein product [Eruca vesicaria subsp. sativa]|uniref:Senescence regulator n=1 Tax=Eruca vesicaria subsp. sativa TaxID=29727 RepID=A0ABC8JXA4_ERUVS|nr:unnamed protein product [Eruca vesicaria subsp. sativa]
MGKGRRLTISRSERYHHHSGHGDVDGEAAVELELMEEDVWSVMEAHDEPTEENVWTAHSLQTSGGPNGDLMGGLTKNVDARRKKHVASSAPVKVPDWSKILKVESVESIHYNNTTNAADVYDEDWESEMVPPHEYVARSRDGNGGSSVFLGVGRTLKGRDMRRVRDAVWSQTGFNG